MVQVIRRDSEDRLTGVCKLWSLKNSDSFEPPSDKWRSRGPERTLPVGPVGCMRPQEWSESSSSNFIWPCLWLLNHLCISKVPSVFYSPSPFSLAVWGRHSRGHCFSCFADEQTEAQNGMGLTRVRALPGWPLCVSGRVGREASFRDEIPPKMVESRPGEIKVVCEPGCTWEQREQYVRILHRPLPRIYRFPKEPQMLSSPAC